MTPQSATLYAFNVGFGDCFLLRFQYAAERRHVLIDFGSTRQPDKPRPASYLTKVAEQIKDLCDGSLDVVVATHRHKDHIYGFRTNRAGTAPGNVIRSCQPKVILQPWTEHPRAARDATASPDQSEANLHYARALANMESMARAAQTLARDNTLSFSESERQFLGFLGENNIKNRNAVENLMDMAPNRYLCFGSDTGTADILPSVDIDVLGPPTLKQSDEIRQQRPRNEEEYWHLQSAAARAATGAGRVLFPQDVNDDPPPWARWGMSKLRKLRREMVLSIVRQLDDQMNNTSLILLFTVGNVSLLFSGDAQWENWSYALSKNEIVQKLKKVDLYKVGHHGSLNATPKSLWELFDKTGGLVSVMSTKHGVHHHSEETAVPRTTLVEALDEGSTLHSTEDLEVKRNTTEFYVEIPIAL